MGLRGHAGCCSRHAGVAVCEGDAAPVVSEPRDDLDLRTPSAGAAACTPVPARVEFSSAGDWRSLAGFELLNPQHRFFRLFAHTGRLRADLPALCPSITEFFIRHARIAGAYAAVAASRGVYAACAYVCHGLRPRYSAG